MDPEQEHRNLERILIDDVNAGPIRLSYESLRRITNSFSEEIGSGGFGVVYMGRTLQNRRVAVKKLCKTDDFSERRFEEELRCLFRVRHTNIVRLLGYCLDTSKEMVEYNGTHVLAEVWQRFLCFEYVPNRSLKEYLDDESRLHEWDTRYQFIEGICHGLHYLHQQRINHLDLKPANILLDADMVPKIADFGLSRIFGAQTSRAITIHKYGTKGYLAPEFINNGEISFKSDIYSLGIIVRNLLRGSNYMSDFENWQNSLVRDNPQVQRCIEIAQRCVDADQHRRPTVDDIIRLLNDNQAVIMTAPPAFGNRRNQSGTSQQQESLFRKDESGSGQSSVEPRQVERAAAKKIAENCFGEVVDDYKLNELVRYVGKTKTQEDRAREAWRLMDKDEKKEKASRYVDVLKKIYGNGQSTLCLVYNATGDTLYYVTNHDWYGYIGSKVGYPAEIGNGQWAAFHHVHRHGEPSGSMGVVVYRGKKKDGQDGEYLLAWSTPWGFYFRNKSYGEIGGVDYFQRRWDEIYVKVDNSDYSSKTKSGGCEIEAHIDKGDSPKFIATIKADHGP